MRSAWAVTLVLAGCWEAAPHYDPAARHFVPETTGVVIIARPGVPHEYVLADGSTVTLPHQTIWYSGSSQAYEGHLLLAGTSPNPFAFSLLPAQSPAAPDDCFVLLTDEIWVIDGRVNAFRNIGIHGRVASYLSVPAAEGFTAEEFERDLLRGLCIDSSGRAFEYSANIW